MRGLSHHDVRQSGNFNATRSFGTGLVEQGPQCRVTSGMPSQAFELSTPAALYRPARYHVVHVRITTILLDQIFGFDADVGLAPTNTFHLGFWFNDIQDVVNCGVDPKKTTPFNGEHKAGPFAMISRPEPLTKLGPLCSDPNASTNPVSCNP